MQVLVEEEFEATESKIVLEESTGSKKYIVEGVMMQSEVKNRNGRVYPRPVMMTALNRYITEYVDKHRAVGELNHPKDDPRINYERVSHRFEYLRESGNDVIGRAVIANKTPMGSVVAGLMDAGVQMGTSSRAVGDVKLFEGVKVVQSNFRIITAGDIVSDPSAPDAYLTNLMENKEWVYANGVLVERESEIKNAVNTMARTKTLTEENMQTLFTLIMGTISKGN